MEYSQPCSNEMYYVDRATWPQSYHTPFSVLTSLIPFGKADGVEWKDTDLFVSAGFRRR